MSKMSEPQGKRGKRSRRITSQTLLAAVPDMMFRLNRDGDFLDYKPAEGLEPYRPPDEFLGQNARHVLPTDMVDGLMPLIESVVTTGEAQTYNYHLAMDDGVHNYEARIVGLGEDEVLCIVRDLTARVKHYELTPREVEVLRLIAVGITDKEIADRLEISVLTVRKHVASIRKKMGAASRTEAAVVALREGLVR